MGERRTLWVLEVVPFSSAPLREISSLFYDRRALSGDAKLFQGLNICDKWNLKAEKLPANHIMMDLFLRSDKNAMDLQQKYPVFLVQ